MKVALVLTPFNQLSAIGFSPVRTRYVYGYSIPLGIAYLARVLEQAGYQVKVLDPCPLNFSVREITAWIVSEKPDILGISASTHVALTAYQLAGEVKKRLPSLPIIMGGSHCTVFPEQVLDECPDVDTVVIGEGEERIVPLIESLVKGKSLAPIPGLVFRNQNGKSEYTGPPPIQKDLDTIPFPARYLFDRSRYIPFPDQMRKSPVTHAITSRGCAWHKCKFCYEGGRFMPRYRRRSPENVTEELIEIRRQGFRGVAFWDDNFCISEKWVGHFCELLREQNLGFTWTCFGRVDTITEKMIRDIKSSGCFSIYFGFESGNQEILDLVNKGTTLEQAKRAVSLCHRAKIEVRGSFILGMPGDTPILAKKTIEFAKELDLDSVKFMLYTPEVGTELYDLALSRGNIVRRGFQGSLSQATYLPHGYSSTAQLENISLEANRSYLLRLRFILKKLLTIRSWQDIRKYLDGLLMVLSLKRTIKE